MCAWHAWMDACIGVLSVCLMMFVPQGISTVLSTVRPVMRSSCHTVLLFPPTVKCSLCTALKKKEQAARCGMWR